MRTPFTISKPLTKVLLFPLSILLLLAGIFVFTLKRGYSVITNQSDQINILNVEAQTLEVKYKLLSQVDKSVLDTGSETVVALPIMNSSLLMSSQLKEGGEPLLTTSDFSLSSEIASKDDIKSASINFLLSTKSISETVAFLEKIGSLAPVSSIDVVSINLSQDVVNSDITLTVYWSELQSSLPAIGEPVNDLTSEEVQILNYITQLKAGTFTTLHPDKPALNRVDPFR